jgi:hypothetical protein
MRGTRLRSTVRSVVAVLCAACFLAMSVGSVTRAAAADAFETWPKKTAEPGVQPNPAAEAGDEGGKKAAAGLFSGTTGWIVVGVAAAIGIAVAAGGGGGGGGSTSNH